MGEIISKVVCSIIPNSIRDNVKSIISRKRKHGPDDDESDEETNRVTEKIMTTPKRIKLTCTPDYIYQVLFKEGKGSDINVNILGKSWRLHKIYLSQCPYFASMFSGAWKEATEDSVNIEIVDPNVTVDSLSLVLGSLYCDTISIVPGNVVSILATASIFQFDGIVEQCITLMVDTVSSKNVMTYYNVGKMYSLKPVTNAAYKWLLVNLMGLVYNRPERLKDINMDLMMSLVSSSDLFVIQTEFAIYQMLRNWTYLQLHPDSPSFEPAQKFFSENPSREAFLLTEQGRAFVPVFRSLRLPHLVTHHNDVETMKSDRILPDDWLIKPVTRQWYQMLRLDHGLDKGPRRASRKDFYAHSLRCGRILKTDDENVWRWTGYNFGLDLVWTVAHRMVHVRRNHRNDSPDGDILLSHKARRHVMIRVTVASLNSMKQVAHSQGTGIKAITFSKDQEVMLLFLHDEITFPLYVSVNLLVTSMVPDKTDLDITGQELPTPPPSPHPSPSPSPPLQQV